MNLAVSTFTALLVCVTLPAPVLAGDLPDPRITPGAINPAVSQQNIHSTICVKSYTKGIRPPMFFTNALKKTQLRQYGNGFVDLRLFEEDHLIPLSLGGHPQNPHNLWPQPRNSQWGADQKDELELVLAKMVCAGELPLDAARAQIAHDWITAYKAYVPSHPQYLRRRSQL